MFQIFQLWWRNASKMILTCLAEKKLLQIVKFFGQNVKVRAIEVHKAALISIPSALSK